MNRALKAWVDEVAAHTKPSHIRRIIPDTPPVQSFTLPAILLSAHGSDAASERVRQLGAYFVAKPFDTKALLSQVREMAAKP